ARILGAKLSDDAKTAYALSDAGRDWMTLVSIDVASGKSATLLDEPRDATGLDVARTDDQKTIVATTLDTDGLDVLVVLELAGDRVARRTDVPLRGVSTGIAVAPHARFVFAGVTRPDLPGEIVRIDLSRGSTVQVTESDHGGVDLGLLSREQRLFV